MGPEIPNCNNFEVVFPSGVSALPVWVYFLGAQLHVFFSLAVTVAEWFVWTTVPEVFTIRPFLRKLCWYLLCLMNTEQCV